MKSVGEVMAIGRTFKESFQKALRGLEVGVDGLNQKTTDREKLQIELGEPGPERIWYVGDAFAQGFSLDEIGRASCRERVCQYVEISVGADSLKKKIR